MPSLEQLPTVGLLPASPARRHAWIAALLDLIFPPFCPVCQQRLDEARRDPLCGVCWQRLERIAAPYCRVCGVPFPTLPWGGTDQQPPDAHLCGRCRRRRPPFSYARAAARYGDVARAAVHAFKFGGRRALASPLGDLLAEMGPRLPVAAPELLVPVPLHPQRERERGFNQSLLLARRLGRLWKVPVRADVLRRKLATLPQTELTAAERRSNVRNAFALRRPELVQGRHVVLVDDVFTTGSTVTACAVCLKAGGASTVGILTVARAI